MNKIVEGRLYKSEESGMIRHYIEFIILLSFMAVDIYGLWFLFNSNGLAFLTFTNYNIFKFLFLISAIFFFLYLLYANFFWCNHGIITKETIIGLNGFRVKRQELFFNEIDQINSYGKNYNILITDINGKRLVLNPAMDPTEDFINEILKRAVNCRKIDLRYLRKEFKNLLIYEKGIEK